MSTPHPPRVTEAREKAHEEAARAGIDRELISNLVDTFYENVRAHPALGPIFDGQIQDNWEPHLETMKQFWGSLVFHDGQYSGRPMPAHMKLKDQVHRGHFLTWLALFDQSLQEIGASEEARNWFLERATRIANSFQLQMYYTPH
ncbi:MAG: group III truncated hemoglobin [Maricaulis sp.]|uniref:group III truncated hemoglobin n=1 Tax=Maricaulis sp. TaxID=1486257 RepID=UPI001B194DAE|nr:group III truncated hemoglobin [Maricaulis sp.]MBO6847440.1 group III truncated hemoglobin [Maricaulis sp.]MBO6878236.1 group III truncated hemoglobin [Maricaulis sp.]